MDQNAKMATTAYAHAPATTLQQAAYHPAQQQTAQAAQLAALQEFQAPQWAMPQFQQPSYVPPPSLTAGMPDPTSVEQQKIEHLKGLQAREKQSLDALEQQRQ